MHKISEYIKPGSMYPEIMPEGHIPHLVDGLWCAVKIPIIHILEEAVRRFKEGY